MGNIISAIICTYNRCESLAKALDSLCHLESNGRYDYEILVVDNNSGDKTKEVVENYAPKFNGRLRYLFEPEQGISNARNKGIKEAKGEIIAFTDDDCIADKNWLLSIQETFTAYGCDALGGRILPVYPSNTPRWIKDNNDLLCGPIVMHDYGEDTKKHKNPMTEIIGANMAFKKTVFRDYGLFRPDLGVGQGTMGEETELIRRLRKKQLKIYYCGKALIFHSIDTGRTNLKYIAKWNIAYGRFQAIKELEFNEKSVVCHLGSPRYLYRQVMGNFLLSILNFYNRRAFLNYYINLFRKIGMISRFRSQSRHQNARNEKPWLR